MGPSLARLVLDTLLIAIGAMIAVLPIKIPGVGFGNLSQSFLWGCFLGCLGTSGLTIEIALFALLFAILEGLL
jgi:hypothetical protein